jgi:flagellar protein FlaG
MNIQPLGPAAAIKPDERPTGAVEPASAATPSTAAGAIGKSDGAPASRAEVTDALKKINDAMRLSSQSLQFSIDEDSKQIVVKVIDQDTKEVVRQMPSQEALEIAKSIDKMRGLLIDHTA